VSALGLDVVHRADARDDGVLVGLAVRERGIRRLDAGLAFGLRLVLGDAGRVVGGPGHRAQNLILRDWIAILALNRPRSQLSAQLIAGDWYTNRARLRDDRVGAGHRVDLNPAGSGYTIPQPCIAASTPRWSRIARRLRGACRRDQIAPDDCVLQRTGTRPCTLQRSNVRFGADSGRAEAGFRWRELAMRRRLASRPALPHTPFRASYECILAKMARDSCDGTATVHVIVPLTNPNVPRLPSRSAEKSNTAIDGLSSYAEGEAGQVSTDLALLLNVSRVSLLLDIKNRKNGFTHPTKG
jgi:hypothetical protein